MSGSREDPIDKAIKDLVDRNVCPDSDMVNPIQQRLNHNKMEAILECNYGKAQECERSLEVLKIIMDEQKKKEIEEESLNELFLRWRELMNQKKCIVSGYDIKRENVRARFSDEESEIKQRQSEEQKEFQSKWSDPVFLKQFNKPSNKLTQLRDQEKAMVISKQFEDAKELKAIGDRIQKQETQMAERRLSAQMAREKSKLDAKQRSEIEQHHARLERVLKEISDSEKRQLQPIDAALETMRFKKRNKTLPKLTSRSVTSSGTRSPRTQRLFASYKAERNITRLTLNPQRRYSTPVK